jgi:hypothetical protein
MAARKSSSSKPHTARSRTVRTADRAYRKVRTAVKSAARETTKQQQAMKRAAEKQLDHAKKRWDSAERNVRSYIRKNPKKAAAIAAGVAVAIGAAAAAAMRRKR